MNEGDGETSQGKGRSMWRVARPVVSRGVLSEFTFLECVNQVSIVLSPAQSWSLINERTMVATTICPLCEDTMLGGDLHRMRDNC